MKMAVGGGVGKGNMKALTAARFKLAGQAGRLKAGESEVSELKDIMKMQQRAAEEQEEMSQNARVRLEEKGDEVERALREIEFESNESIDTLRHMDALMACLDDIVPRSHSHPDLHSNPPRPQAASSRLYQEPELPG